MSGYCLRHHYTGNGFFYSLLLLLLGNNRGVGLSRFSLGELIAAPKCANRTGESGLFFCFLSHLFFSKLVTTILPLWEIQRVDLSCLVLLFAALTNTRAPCVTGYSLSQSEKKRQMFDYYIVCFYFFCFYFAKHIGVGFGRMGKLYMNNEIWFCGSGFSKGFSRAFPFIFGIAPFRCCCKSSWELLAVLEQRIDVIRGILFGACVWFRYRGLKAYRTRIYECLNKRFICLVMSLCLSAYRGKAIQHPYPTLTVTQDGS